MNKQKRKWPILLLVLDLLGAIIAAVGLIEYLDTGSLNAIILLVAGLFLMLPLILHILKLMPRKGTGNSKGEH
ncbi:MAG: hypothetical protein KBT53_07590 [Porticoccus sp.]|nr:hypothetical protein [Porticoccus sp.]MBQ0806760.1 hypothetical protein [Porticoccus sp.]